MKKNLAIIILTLFAIRAYSQDYTFDVAVSELIDLKGQGLSEKLCFRYHDFIKKSDFEGCLVKTNGFNPYVENVDSLNIDSRITGSGYLPLKSRLNDSTYVNYADSLFALNMITNNWNMQPIVIGQDDFGNEIYLYDSCTYDIVYKEWPSNSKLSKINQVFSLETWTYSDKVFDKKQIYTSYDSKRLVLFPVTDTLKYDSIGFNSTSILKLNTPYLTQFTPNRIKINELINLILFDIYVGKLKVDTSMDETYACRDFNSFITSFLIMKMKSWLIDGEKMMNYEYEFQVSEIAAIKFYEDWYLSKEGLGIYKKVKALEFMVYHQMDGEKKPTLKPLAFKVYFD